jgi:hypothetical protein
MPIYTCTIRESIPGTDTKAVLLAREMARIHSSVNHVPSTYVNVVFPSYRQTAFTPTVSSRAQCLSAMCDMSREVDAPTCEFGHRCR